MKFIKLKLKENEFLLKIVITTILGVVVTALVTIYLFVAITENNILDTYRASQQRIMDDIAETYDHAYNQLISFQNNIKDKPLFYEYLNDFDKDSSDSRVRSYEMTQFFKNQQAIFNDINFNIFLLSDQSVYYAFGDQRIYDVDTLNQEAILSSVSDNPYDIFLSDHGFTNLTQYDAQLVFITPLVYKNETYGKAITSVGVRDFENVYRKLLDHNATFMFLRNDETIYPKTITTENLSNTQHIYNESKLEIPNIKIASYIERTSLINDVYRIRTVSLSIFVVALVLAAILFKIVKTITQPLYELSDALIKYDHKPQHIAVHGTYEIQNLIHSYNAMVDDLDIYIQDIIDLEHQKRNSDLIALQRQINPHFMYNTLTSIRFLIMSNQNHQAQQALLDFIILLQSLSNFDSQMVSVASEIEVLHHYIQIQKLRFGPNINVNVNVPEALKDFKIPKLMLQPFIENALFHAFQDNKGYVNISFNSINDNLMIEIMDNGVGIDNQMLENIYEQMEAKSPSKHIGIANVHQRIQLLYGKEFGITLHSQTNLGTIVKIILPLI